MKQFILILILFFFENFANTQTYIPYGYIELFKYEKQVNLDCNFNVYYKTGVHKVDFIINSTDLKLKGEYKLIIVNIFGEKSRNFIEKDIKAPEFFSKELDPGTYYIKIINKYNNYSFRFIMN
jgi:hypothetical protein